MRQNWCLTSPKGTVGVERVWRQRVVFGDGDIVWRRGLCCESGQSHLGDEKVHFGVTDMSPHSMTLVSGFVAVISVNVVIAFYICLAMREPADKHEPDPKFLAEAKASVEQLGKNQDGDSSGSRTKQE
ncbi:Vacuolar ATPase assembly integral membrane protein VMA21-like domain isoform 4 [Capsicum annuum]|nr:Vacuolar ATPase assembly integral membrane protein VMA21-like domain isoform 4 [Capsicum annuum]